MGIGLSRLLVERGFPIVVAIRDTVEQNEARAVACISSISASTDWSQALLHIQTVIHLAARVHVMNDKATDSLAAFREVNLHGTINLARQAATAGVKRFVYVSSIKVNGEYTTENPFSEADEAQPQDPYGISKWEAEQALWEVSDETGMEVVIVRPPLVYGPGVKANFYNLLRIVYKALPLPLGSINNHRSMIYVENLVDALITCATHSQAAGKTYLVSDGKDISTPGLINQLAKAMSRPCRMFSVPLSWMRFFARLTGKSAVLDRLTQSLVIDSSRIRRELQWVPPYSLDEGLQATADWYISNCQDTERY